MPHHVYANNNEIASKSSDGKSTAAAPDVCFTTPPSVAAGTPVPFTNTCYAKDITNGSRTVFIKSAEIALENKSFFKKSTGDEGATEAHKKGIVSGKIKGKCYFASWSPNVKVEGFSVARHMDTVTHNHTNQANTPKQKFQSLFEKTKECDDAKKEINSKCAPPKQDDKGKSNKSKKKVKRGKIGKILKNPASMADDLAKETYAKLGYKPKKDNQWIEDHCDGLWIKPTGANRGAFGEFKKEIEKYQELATSSDLGVAKTILEELGGIAVENLGDWARDKLEKFAIKSGVKLGIGAAVGTTGVGLIVTGLSVIWTVYDMKKLAEELAEQLGDVGKEYVDMIADPDKFKQQVKDKIQEYVDEPQKALSDAMSAMAKKNPCVNARKCMLVPYNESQSAADQAKKGDACCPGQTGHHIIPGDAFDGLDCYNHQTAHTICLEGTNCNPGFGSHGDAHGALADSVTKKLDRGVTTETYEQAKKRGLDAVEEYLPKKPKNCRDCIEAQMDESYEACKNEEIKVSAGTQSC